MKIVSTLVCGGKTVSEELLLQEGATNDVQVSYGASKRVRIDFTVQT